MFIQGGGPDDYLYCPITSVEKEKMEEKTLYTIEYTIHDAPYLFTFYYQPVNGGRIRLKNQPDIRWTIDAPTDRIKTILSSLERSKSNPGSD